MCFILAMIIFLQQRISRYALLVGTVVGWGAMAVMLSFITLTAG